jgi:hypothetical protein
LSPPDSDLRGLSADAAIRTFGIDKLRQHSSEVLLPGWHAKQHARGAHVPVKSLAIRPLASRLLSITPEPSRTSLGDDAIGYHRLFGSEGARFAFPWFSI